MPECKYCGQNFDYLDEEGYCKECAAFIAKSYRDKDRITLVAVPTKESTCEGCIFDEQDPGSCSIGGFFPCDKSCRKDHQNVIWKEANSEGEAKNGK